MAEASPPNNNFPATGSPGGGGERGAVVVVDRGDSASVRGLNRLLGDARGTLRTVGVFEAVVAGGAAVVAAVVVACVVVGVAPFSLLLRDVLFGVVVVAGAGAAVGTGVARLWPLRHDFVVGARIEAALRRRGVDVRDLVRSAVELRDSAVDGKVGRSRALCDAHIGRAVDVVRHGQALTSLPRVALEQAVPTLLAAAAVVVVIGGWWIASPATLSARLAKLFDRGAVEAALAERALQQTPLVTDLTITLRFPAYMNARDEVIPGASGDVTAPKGTEVIVQGRADRVVDSAALVVSGGQRDPKAAGAVDAAGAELALAAEVSDQKNLKARFVVANGGAWRFRVVDKDGDTVVDPVARKIVLRDDAAPSVTIDEPEKDGVVQLDDDVDLAFGASDDNGVTEVRVVVKRQGSARQPYVKKLQDVPGLRQVRGRGEFNVGDVGARPGEKLAVTIEAVDNDTVSGPKVGRSTTRVLTVFSATQHHREVIQRLEQLLGQMVEVLGDELEAPFAPEKEAAGMRRVLERHKQTAPRATQMMTLFDETLAAVGSDALMDEAGDGGVRRALANMRLDLQRAELEKHTAVDRTPLPVADRPAPPSLWRRLIDTQGVFVGRLEKHILYLEDLLQRERVLEAQKLVKDMKRAQQDLKDLLQQYKESGDPQTRDALLDEIRKMQQQLQELAARLGELRREIPDEYLNEEAFKGDEMVEKAESLDEMIEEGRLDDAAKALEQMLEQTQKMVDELDKTDDDMAGGENKELQEKMERFGQELEALEKGQEEELQETEQAMEQARKKAEAQLKQKLEKAIAEAKKKAQKAMAELQKVTTDGLSPLEEEDVEAAKARTEDLQKALDAGDVEDALRTSEQAEAAAKTAEQSIDDKQRGRYAFSSKTMEKSEKALAEAGDSLAEARKILEEAMPDPSDMMDAKEKERLGKQGDRQQQLGEQAQKLGQLLDEIGKEAPIFGPEHKKQVDDARAAMERASRQLKGQSKGRGSAERDGVRGARQSQSQALQSLRALKKAMEEMGKGGGSGGMPMPLPGGGSPGSESDDAEDGRGNSKEEVKIPDGSDFKVKDAFRKDILDAMREGAPQDWAGEVKKYYEELIK